MVQAEQIDQFLMGAFTLIVTIQTFVIRNLRGTMESLKKAVELLTAKL